MGQTLPVARQRSAQVGFTSMGGASVGLNQTIRDTPVR